jgi:hypothetical protein
MTDKCEFCGNNEPCTEWKCIIEMHKKAGHPQYTPNNLPIMCIRADGLMLEIEGGDHPDYKFPVQADYIGPKDETRYQTIDGSGNISVMEDWWKEAIDHEAHALLYANESVAVTLYETCSAVWALSPKRRLLPDKTWEILAPAGRCIGGSLWRDGEWALTQESLDKIQEYLKQKTYIPCNSTVAIDQ